MWRKISPPQIMVVYIHVGIAPVLGFCLSPLQVYQLSVTPIQQSQLSRLYLPVLSSPSASSKPTVSYLKSRFQEKVFPLIKRHYYIVIVVIILLTIIIIILFCDHNWQCSGITPGHALRTRCSTGVWTKVSQVQDSVLITVLCLWPKKT